MMLKLVDSVHGFGKVVVSDAEYLLDQFVELEKNQMFFGMSLIMRKDRNVRPELKFLGTPDLAKVETLIRQINDEQESDERHLFDGWDEQALKVQS